MKKENFVTLIMSVVGGLIFAPGMCMTTVRSDLMIPGIIGSTLIILRLKHGWQLHKVAVC